ncbi:hypothetical protein CHF27_003960 [Romboutsia maritimum]|uniref:VCBS repeat-containing protein n=1 Tax=Romboutsia maritimum TaxID=2020948 RepID=A0A371IUU0_9FIRM|nr:hypothetical protein [Romboutsia maritimum]RDY24244.1 hypothetical protein CHF27_003960 [Romboutsia maritimum]
MKLFKLIPLIFLLMSTTTGCSTSTESPERLIKKPIVNESKLGISNAISKSLTVGYSLVLPNNSMETGKINEVDLDNDDTNEIVAFEKKEGSTNNENEVGFMVLSKNKDGSYTDKGKIWEKGDSIEYANFYDLDSDGNKEIVLLVKSTDKTNMYIYKFKNGEINKVYTLNPTWLEDKDELLDMKIKIGNIDKNKGLDILMFHYNSKNNQMYASLAEFKETLKVIDHVKFENVKNLSDLHITIGNVTKDIKGVILDYTTLKESNNITQILYIENNKINKAFDDNDKNLMKAYYIPTEDMNKDKIIEIPILNGKANGSTYTLKSASNVSWYKWNGKIGKDSGLVFINQIYYNYQYTYKILVPNNLVNKLYVEQEYPGENILFKFIYYDTLNSESKELFTICAINKSAIDENKNMSNKTGVKLNETEDYIFSLYTKNTEELKKLNITVETLKDYFSLIYE